MTNGRSDASGDARPDDWAYVDTRGHDVFVSVPAASATASAPGPIAVASASAGFVPAVVHFVAPPSPDEAYHLPNHLPHVEHRTTATQPTFGSTGRSDTWQLHAQTAMLGVELSIATLACAAFLCLRSRHGRVVRRARAARSRAP